MATTTVTETNTTQLQAQAPPLPAVDHLDKHGYLFGQKLTASMSPLLHDIVYKNIGLNWAQSRLDSTDMDLFLKLRQHPKFYGESISQLLWVTKWREKRKTKKKKS